MDDHPPATPTPQQRADSAEAAAIETYRAMRDAWSPCWGATRLRGGAAGRPRRREPAAR